MSRFALKSILLCALGLLMAAPSAAQQASTHPAGWGGHGMAVFGGREGLYASHLPMFHAPHDAQVILKFHLQDASVDAALRTSLADKPELWTLDPEPFDLHRLQPGHAEPLMQFVARFVQGHFERGGLERYVGQTLIVDEVILFRRIAPTEKVHSEGRYLLIGKGSEYFLIKQIDRRPDFDIIVALKSQQPIASSKSSAIMMPTDHLHEPTAESLNEALSIQAGKGFTYQSTIYFETTDLQ
jgi:hypothetical protein